MLSLLSLLAAVPWRWLAASALVSVLFIGGCRFGERRITTQWEADKIATAQAVTSQSVHVAQVTEQQTTINQEISDEFKKAKAELTADRHRLLFRVPLRVRVEPPNGESAMPNIPVSAAGVTPVAADPVPPSETSCEKLAEDAAQTTLMLIEFQRWYRAQSRLD